MYELINISNYHSDLDMFKSTQYMASFLQKHGLDGFEVMFCAPWDKTKLPSDMIKGVHLRYWPIWLDFWRGNEIELLRQFGNKQNIERYYGGLQRDALITTYRENLKQAVDAGAEYVVFHVSHAREAEIFTWDFSASDREVVAATIELVNVIMSDVPPNVAILFENLWWPGLTLLDTGMIEYLINGIKHKNKGLMLDVGHLLNTNQSLTTQQQAVDYVIRILKGLGPYRAMIRGMHLHYSLSGEYVIHSRITTPHETTMEQLINHVMNIDQHKPFTHPEVGRIVECVNPDYLVHEFVYSSLPELSKKVTIQRRTLGAFSGGRMYGTSKV